MESGGHFLQDKIAENNKRKISMLRAWGIYVLILGQFLIIYLFLITKGENLFSTTMGEKAPGLPMGWWVTPVVLLFICLWDCYVLRMMKRDEFDYYAKQAREFYIKGKVADVREEALTEIHEQRKFDLKEPDEKIHYPYMYYVTLAIVHMIITIVFWG